MTTVLSSSPMASRWLITRPIWASVWETNPAYTSCMRANSRRASASRSSQGCTHEGRSVSVVPSDEMPEANCRSNARSRHRSHPSSNIPR